jgi:aspartyl-tRNA(Asn)/glutamyl-tRNA(Gln) amidotransferase subunit C
MKLSRQEVEHVAALARLHLTQEEMDLFTQQLNDILLYMEKLQEVNTQGIQPTSHALHLANAFREDQVMPSLDQSEALSIAPEQGRSSFVVPKVI